MAVLWAGLQAALSHALPPENSSSKCPTEPWQGGTAQDLLQQHKDSHLSWEQGAPLLPGEPLLCSTEKNNINHSGSTIPRRLGREAAAWLLPQVVRI